MKQEDFFNVLCNKGELLISGFNESFQPIRIIKYNNKKFELILKEVEE